MNKYIDADKAKNCIMEFVNEYGEIVGMFVNDFNILLERCAADVAEVVRCKDCKMYCKDKELAKAKYCDPNYYCGLLQTEMDEDGFCSYGRRKGGFFKEEMSKVSEMEMAYGEYLND